MTQSKEQGHAVPTPVESPMNDSFVFQMFPYLRPMRRTRAEGKCSACMFTFTFRVITPLAGKYIFSLQIDPRVRSCVCLSVCLCERVTHRNTQASDKQDKCSREQSLRCEGGAHLGTTTSLQCSLATLTKLD